MSSGPYSILLIEDNPLDAELTRSRLEAGGVQFELTVVDNRRDFEECLKNRTFDLVLADDSQPDFDGLSALEIVRAQDEQLPFLFVSGVVGEAAADTLQQAMDPLVPAVKRALKEHADYRLRERAELELKQVERRFESLTNALPAMVWTADLSGRLTFVNSEWTRCVGRAQVLFDANVVHPRDLPAMRNAWERAQGSGQSFEVDCRYRMQTDGSYRWHLVRGIPLTTSEGVATEWVGTCTDVEKQRSREARLRTTEKLALTGRLSSVIAHEINNPLEALTNILYLLSSGVLSQEDSRLHLNLAEQELMRISAITRQTLQWSREEAVIAEVTGETLVEDALKLFGRKLQNKSLRVTKEYDPHVVVRVVAGEMRQVLANLISNAIDAMELAGNLTLCVGVLERGGERLASIAVKDDGCGISPERLAQIFQPFESSKGAMGSGLGLFISKELVERYGGDLVVESEVERGTTMSILLPLIEQQAPVAAEPQGLAQPV